MSHPKKKFAKKQEQEVEEEHEEEESTSSSHDSRKKLKGDPELSEAELAKLEKRRKKVAQASRVLRAKRKIELENLKNETQKLKLENQKLLKELVSLKTKQDNSDDPLVAAAVLGKLNEITPNQFPNVVTELGSNSKAIISLMTHIRDKNTIGADYVRYSNRVCRLLAEEGLAMTCSSARVITPTGKEYNGHKYPSSIAKELCVISIMRAGDALCEAVREIVPEIPVGKVLIQRQEHTVEKSCALFWSKFPLDISRRQILVTDPMLGTGGTIITCVKELIKAKVSPKNILFLNIVSCPEGLNRLAQEFPDVRVVTCSIDPALDSSKYIIPGLGDFGDRFFHTTTNQ